MEEYLSWSCLASVILSIPALSIRYGYEMEMMKAIGDDFRPKTIFNFNYYNNKPDRNEIFILIYLLAAFAYPLSISGFILYLLFHKLYETGKKIANKKIEEERISIRLEEDYLEAKYEIEQDSTINHEHTN